MSLLPNRLRASIRGLHQYVRQLRCNHSFVESNRCPYNDYVEYTCEECDAETTEWHTYHY